MLNLNQEANSYLVTKKFWSYIKSKRNVNTGVFSLKNSDGRLISNGIQKAEIQFESVFIDENLTNIPELPNSNIPNIC